MGGFPCETEPSVKNAIYYYWGTKRANVTTILDGLITETEKFPTSFIHILVLLLNVGDDPTNFC